MGKILKENLFNSNSSKSNLKWKGFHHWNLEKVNHNQQVSNSLYNNNKRKQVLALTYQKLRIINKKVCRKQIWSFKKLKSFNKSKKAHSFQ